MRLLPKDESFWKFFTQQTSGLSSAASILAEAARSGNSALPNAAVRIKAIEQESANTMHELHRKLHKTFVAPIDPEDISLLSGQIDRLLDDFEAICYRLVAYRLEPAPQEITELAEKARRSAELIERAFGFLSMSEPVDELCHEIRALKEQVDQAVRDAVTRLFDQEKDLIAVMKQKEIYDIFGRLNESTQDLANTLDNVAIKNS